MAGIGVTANSLVTAALLALVQNQPWLNSLTSPRPLRLLADMSYSLFLVHFPTCLVLNAWWSSHLPANPWLALVGMVTAWGLSMAASFLFYHFVEKRLSGLRLAESRDVERQLAPARAGQVGARKVEEGGRVASCFLTKDVGRQSRS